ncbi:MAG: molybdopterin-dependent oxidoreductase [Mycobacteriales bacterium]
MASGGGIPVGRRIVIGMVAVGAAGVAFGDRLSAIEQSLLAPIQSRDPTGLSALLPDDGGFRFYSVTGSTPTRTAETYRLTVGGLVDRSGTLMMSDLASMPQTSLTRDFQCVTGWRVPDVHWSGVALPDLLDRVGVRHGATAVRFTSFDGTYTESLTLAQARRSDVLVATSMLGGPVSREHGGPVRLYVAPMYGYKSCKWLGGIELTARVEPGYWEHYGYSVDAWVGHSNGRDDTPTG